MQVGHSSVCIRKLMLVGGFRTNCSTDKTCWRAALTYQTSELVERLFSFGSLAVHVSTFQQAHSDEVGHKTFMLAVSLCNGWHVSLVKR